MTHDLMPLRSFPAEGERVTGAVTVRPRSLFDDEGAFACKLQSESLLPVLKPGVMLYCTRTRAPSAGDIGYFKTKDNADLIRVVTEQTDDGFKTLTGKIADDDDFREIVEDVLFDDLVEVACVTMIEMHAI